MGQAAQAKTPDGRFSYIEAGEISAIPVVFLHGIGGGAGLWSNQIATFAERYRPIALDLPGYGDSQPLAETSIRTYAEAVADLIASLGLEDPVLVGHSIGGMVVQTFMAEGLGPIRAAVLAQTTPAFGGKDPRWAEDFVAARLGPLDRGETMRSLAPSIAASLLGDDPNPTAFELARDCVSGVPEGTWRASVLALVGFDQREALDRIGVPTLLLAGSKDQNAPAPTMAKMAEKVPASEYVCLDGIGHLAFAEAPARFDEAVLGFLDRRLGTEGAAQ